MDEKKKADVIQLFKDSTSPPSGQSIHGNNNIQAGGDVNINKREIVRPVIKTDPARHITDQEAYQIRHRVHKVAEVDIAGGMPTAKAYQKWWSILKRRYEVTSYKEIPAGCAEEAISYLKQQAAINRPKLRRTNPKAWRDAHFTAIWAKSKSLGMSKGEVYAMVLVHIEKRVVSLKQLTDSDLKKLYAIIMAKQQHP